MLTGELPEGGACQTLTEPIGQQEHKLQISFASGVGAMEVPPGATGVGAKPGRC